jgi:hypothetical protein
MTTTADEFVHITMAFADDLCNVAVQQRHLLFGQRRDELRRHLEDSAAALQLEAFCDGMKHAERGWTADALVKPEGC